MSVMNEHHKTLTNGKGKCSVPMWIDSCPAGFCDEDAFGNRPHCKTWHNYASGLDIREDGRYSGYVPGLACVGHGGPECPGKMQHEP